MNKRFYPDSVPLFPHEPTTDLFAIRKLGDNVGEGVGALKTFYPGDIIFAFTGFMIDSITQFSLKYADGLHLHDPFFMGKVLHSCEPNSYCDMSRRLFVATKVINSGEIITMDYAQTEDVLFKSFFCSCGSSKCRGYVTGRLERDMAETMLQKSQA
jgi:hypothetical protein